MHLPSTLRYIMAAAAVLAATAMADDDESPTVNACISPQACFTDNNDNPVDYCITSPWYINYPAALRKNLAKEENITLFDWNTPEFDRCGWNQGSDSIYKLSVDRGTIYYKAQNASLDFRPPQFPEDTYHVVAAMKATYPITEIMLILLFLVILPIGLPALCICLAITSEWYKKWGGRWRAYRARRAEKVRWAKQEKEDARAAKRAAREAEKGYGGSTFGGTTLADSESSGARSWDEKSPV